MTLWAAIGPSRFISRKQEKTLRNMTVDSSVSLLRSTNEDSGYAPLFNCTFVDQSVSNERIKRRDVSGWVGST